jgi:hypothetical protein
MPQLSQIPPTHLPEAPSATSLVRGGASTTEVATKVAAAPALPNPALRLDPGLGLVVLEFRDNRGEVAETIPTPRELEAYRTAARTTASLPGAGNGLPQATPAGAVS